MSLYMVVISLSTFSCFSFFFNDTATTEIYTLSLHDALPIHDRWLGLLDEGYVLAIADEVNRGRALYRDIWIDNPFPGAFTLLALWFRLAGTSIASSRLLTLGGFAVYASALFCF